jgi:hypothetical protein
LKIAVVGANANGTIKRLGSGRQLPDPTRDTVRQHLQPRAVEHGFERMALADGDARNGP